MTFTYAGALATDVEKVRFEIQDVTAATALFTDEEIQAKLTERGGRVLHTAADLCEVLATRFAYDVDFEYRGGTDVGGKFSKSQRAKAYTTMAAKLRERANLAGNNGGLSTIGMTRVDGMSDDISARQKLAGYPSRNFGGDDIGAEVDEV